MTDTDTDDADTSPQALRLRHAAIQLARIDQRRAVAQLSVEGNNIPQIAMLLGITDIEAHTVLRTSQRIGVEVSPRELMFRAAVDRTPRDELVAALCETADPFTASDIEYGHYSGYLSDTEYEQIKAALGEQP